MVRLMTKLFVISLLVAAISIGCGSNDVKFAQGEKQIWEMSGYSLEEAKAFKRAGLSFQEASGWKAVGFGLDEIIAWKKAGFESVEAGIWKRNMFQLDDAIEWKNSGFSVHEAAGWKKSQFDFEEAKLWLTEGFDDRLAGNWKSVCSDINQLKSLLLAGFDRTRPRDVQCFTDRGFTITETIELKKANLNCKLASEWKNAGFNVVDTILGYSGGFDSSTGYNELNSWISVGFIINEAIILKRNKFSSHNIRLASKFKNHGYELEQLISLNESNKMNEAEKMLALKISNNEILEWIESDFSFEEAEKRIALNIDVQQAKSYRNSGMSFDDMKQEREQKENAKKAAAFNEPDESNFDDNSKALTTSQNIDHDPGGDQKIQFVSQDEMKSLLTDYKEISQSEKALMEYLNLIVGSTETLYNGLVTHGCDRRVLKFIKENPEFNIALLHIIIAQSLDDISINELTLVVNYFTDPRMSQFTAQQKREYENHILSGSRAFFAYKSFRDFENIKNILEAAYLKH